MKSWRCHSLPMYRNTGVLYQLFSSCISKNSVSGIFHLQKASVPSELKIVFRWYLLKYWPNSTCLGRFLIHHDHQHFWLLKPTLKSLTLFQGMHKVSPVWTVTIHIHPDIVHLSPVTYIILWILWPVPWSPQTLLGLCSERAEMLKPASPNLLLDRELLGIVPVTKTCKTTGFHYPVQVVFTSSPGKKWLCPCWVPPCLTVRFWSAVLSLGPPEMFLFWSGKAYWEIF